MKKNKVTVAQAFKEFIWPRRNLVLIGFVLIAISRLSGLVLPGATNSWRSVANVVYTFFEGEMWVVEVDSAGNFIRELTARVPYHLDL